MGEAYEPRSGCPINATVEVFERNRSQVTPLGCQNTNRRGEATLDIDARANTPYLIRISPLERSIRHGDESGARVGSNRSGSPRSSPAPPP